MNVMLEHAAITLPRMVQSLLFLLHLPLFVPLILHPSVSLFTLFFPHFIRSFRYLQSLYYIVYSAAGCVLYSYMQQLSEEHMDDLACLPHLSLLLPVLSIRESLK